MTKVLLCAECLDIRALDPKGAETTCRCGNVTMWWTDPQAGRALVRARDRGRAFFIGLNNDMLIGGLRALLREGPGGAGAFDLSDPTWRALHDVAVEAPNHLFDKSRRDCWAIIVRPGRSNDVTFEEPTEAASA